MNTLILYPKCSTCQKAKKHLEQNNISFQTQHIVEAVPSKEKMKQLIKKSGLPIKKFFNTSGMKYRELQLKDKLPTMSEDEMITLLISDGMLIKRPILETNTQVLIGFKVAEYDLIEK